MSLCFPEKYFLEQKRKNVREGFRESLESFTARWTEGTAKLSTNFRSGEKQNRSKTNVREEQMIKSELVPRDKRPLPASLHLGGARRREVALL